MKRYAEYKDSEIECLGEIPDDWALKRLKFVARVRFSSVNKKSEEGEQQIRLCNYVDVYYNDRITSAIDFMVATASSDEIDRFQLRKGDVLVTKDSEEWDDIAIPAYVADDFEDVICGYHLAQIRSRRELIDGRFLFWLLSSYRLNHQFKVEASGVTRYGLSNYALSNGAVVMPCLEEQKVIADYLDQKTAQINILISKKEQMIEFLKEERTAIINQAVTKGIDPKVELKDSGIEWLGKVPKHWQMKRLKYLVSLVNQSIREAKGAELRIDLENLESWTGKTIELENQDQNNEGMKSFTSGDVLFSKLRPYLAKVYRAKNCGVCGGELLVLRPNILIDSDFIFYRVLSSAFINVVDGSTYGSKMPRASWDFIGNLSVPFPDKFEQTKIVEYLHKSLQGTDIIFQKLSSEIEYLKEYRTALISEVVTGKIDVRESVV